MKRNAFNAPLWITLAASVAALGLSLASCQAGEPELERSAVVSSPLEASSDQAPAADTDHTHPVTVDWMTLDTFPDVVVGSDLVVRARVVDQRPAMKRVLPWNEKEQRRMTPEEAGDVYTDLALTVSTLMIDEVVRVKGNALTVRGDAVAAGSAIEIVELGGKQPDGCFAEPEDKPVLLHNEDAVFFLSFSSRPGAYHVIGGWQGRMNVREGKIYPLALQGHPGAKEFVRFEGSSVDDFLTEVKGISSRAQ